MSKIFIFPIWSVEHTPFGYSVHELEKDEIYIVDDPQKASILVTKFLPKKTLFRALKWKIQFGSEKPLLVWSAEPRDYPETRAYIPSDFLYPEIYVMNMYSSGVYRASGSYYGFHIASKAAYMTEEELDRKSGFIVAVMKYVDAAKPFPIRSLDIDLVLQRQKIVLDGKKLGLVDIYGIGWPDQMAIGGKGCGGNWTDDKVKILQHYKYNICLENTAYPFYITEKIWQSVQGRCLPIYSSFNSSIYDLFPRDSFIDVKDFKNINDLYNFIISLTPDEYIKRFNLCVNVVNNFYENYDLKEEREWVTKKLIKKLQEIDSK